MFALRTAIEAADVDGFKALQNEGVVDEYVKERRVATAPAAGRTLAHLAVASAVKHGFSSASLEVLSTVSQDPVISLERSSDGRTALHHIIAMWPIARAAGIDAAIHGDAVMTVCNAMSDALLGARRRAFVDAAIAELVNNVVERNQTAKASPAVDPITGDVLHTPFVACGADTRDEDHHEAAAMLTLLRCGAANDGRETCIELAIRCGAVVAMDRLLTEAYRDIAPEDSAVAIRKLTAGELPAVPPNALHLAAAHGWPDAIHYFASTASGFRCFADLNQADASRIDKWTPLHAAAYHAKDAAVAMLLSLGARPEAADTFQRTPLHVAGEVEGGLGCMKLLLRGSWDGVSPAADAVPSEATCRLLATRDRGGRTALDAALRQGVTANIDFLVRATRHAELSMNAQQTSTLSRVLPATLPTTAAGVSTSSTSLNVSSLRGGDSVNDTLFNGSKHTVDTSVASPSAARSAVHSTEASRRLVSVASPATDREKLAADLRAAMASASSASDLWRAHRNFVQRTPTV